MREREELKEEMNVCVRERERERERVRERIKIMRGERKRAVEGERIKKQYLLFWWRSEKLSL